MIATTNKFFSLFFIKEREREKKKNDISVDCYKIYKHLCDL